MKKYRRETTSYTGEALNAEDGMRSGIPQDKEITSAQVLFPNRKTLDEVVKELWEKLDELQAEVNALKKKVEGME